MKKILFRILAALAALVALAVLALVVKFYVLSPKSRPAPTTVAPTSPEAIERGRYLVENVTACTGCHSKVQSDVPGEPPVPGMVGAGRDFGVDPLFPGHSYPPNITPDKETGIGTWTDGEIVRAIREGVSRDGRALFPQMPYMTYGRSLSDDDTLAIVAYLRTLKPVNNRMPRTVVDFPVSMFIRGAPAPLAAPPPPAPSPSDKLARGKWLLDVSSCHDCHDLVDSHRNPLPGKAFGGGIPFTTPKGVVVAPNISSDKATGIGAYSDDDLRRVFDEGIGKAGRPLYVMPWSYYKGLTREDKDALIAALRAAPAVANAVAPSQLK